MCGIVGILGSGDVAPRILQALRRLEYRGYDSAGIAVLRDGGMARARAPGKLDRLASRLDQEPLRGPTGIGHTRWATHGVPNETNAHPHVAGAVAIVHNGIIENFRELRDELIARGKDFTSQTDTEVVAHLIDEALAGGRSPNEAVRAVLGRLRGAFAFVHPVPRRAGPDDRRPPRQPAGGRTWRWRDVPRLRFDGARALHQSHHLSRRGRLGGAHPRLLRDLRQRQPAGRAADEFHPGLVAAGRQGQSSSLHGQGDFRAAGSHRPHARRIYRLHRPLGRAGHGNRARSVAASTGSPSPPAAPGSTRR